MKTRFPVIVSVIIGACVLAFLFIGNSMLRNRSGQYGATQHGRVLLGNNAGMNPNGGVPNANRPAPNVNRPNAARIGGVNTTGQQVMFDKQKADTIRNHLGTIDGVGQINAVVLGNTALIGYNSSNPAKNATATRDMITGKVKRLDGSIQNVIVSDSKDFSSRIARLAGNIKNNRPANELTTEFNQLVQSMKPAGR